MIKIKEKPSLFDKKIFSLIDTKVKESTCLRSKIAAVIVKNNKILATAANGNCSKIPLCKDIGCAKEYFKPRSGQYNELCTGLCAEQRAILGALSKGHNLRCATLYCNYSPCTACSRILVELGFKKIFFKKQYRDPLSKQILEMGKIELIKIK